MCTHQHIPLVQGFHKLPKLILPPADGLQRQIGYQRFEKMQLRIDQFGRQTHRRSLLFIKS